MIAIDRLITEADNNCLIIGDVWLTLDDVITLNTYLTEWILQTISEKKTEDLYIELRNMEQSQQK